MGQLFQKNGGQPQAPPFLDLDPDGNTWTDLPNNPEGRAACGWVAAPEPPAYDPVTQLLVWGAEGWEVVDRPPAEEPEPVHVEIKKAVVTERLQALGKFDAFWAVLQADPVSFDLWYSPSSPNVWQDDARVITAFQAGGLTETEIAEVLAA